MAVNVSPTAMWSGFAFDGTDLKIPLADLPGLSAADANATTGDYRAVLLAFISLAYAYYTALADADKPKAFLVRVPAVTPVTSGDLAGTFKTTYELDFYNSYCTPDIADEPA